MDGLKKVIRTLQSYQAVNQCCTLLVLRTFWLASPTSPKFTTSLQVHIHTVLSFLSYFYKNIWKALSEKMRSLGEPSVSHSNWTNRIFLYYLWSQWVNFFWCGSGAALGYLQASGSFLFWSQLNSAGSFPLLSPQRMLIGPLVL